MEIDRAKMDEVQKIAEQITKKVMMRDKYQKNLQSFIWKAEVYEREQSEMSKELNGCISATACAIVSSNEAIAELVRQYDDKMREAITKETKDASRVEKCTRRQAAGPY